MGIEIRGTKFDGIINLVESTEQLKKLNHLLIQARKYIVFFCPFWDAQKVYDTFHCELYDVCSRGVHVFLICRDDIEFKKSLREGYLSLNNIFSSSLRPNLHIYYAKEFHSKIYFNEQSALVTSMNMTNFTKGHDFGIFLNNNQINEIINAKFIDYVKDFLDNSNKEEFLSIVLPKKTEE